MRLFFSLFIVCICLAGCQQYNPKPPDLIPQNKYINLLIELQLLKSYQIVQDPDSATVDSLRHAIFSKYGTTKKQFLRSHTYYKRNVKQQAKRIKKAIERLKQDREVQKDSLAQQDSLARIDSTKNQLNREENSK